MECLNIKIGVSLNESSSNKTCKALMNTPQEKIKQNAVVASAFHTRTSLFASNTLFHRI